MKNTFDRLLAISGINGKNPVFAGQKKHATPAEQRAKNVPELV